MSGGCMSNTDCKAGTDGRCVMPGGLFCAYCGYDACFTDTQCASGEACHCDAFYGNACLPGTCRVDSDCACGYCSPSVDTQTCIPAFGHQTVGYYCHTPQDQCTNDSECPGEDGVCAWQATVGYWACAYPMCGG